MWPAADHGFGESTEPSLAAPSIHFDAFQPTKRSQCPARVLRTPQVHLCLGRHLSVTFLPAWRASRGNGPAPIWAVRRLDVPQCSAL